jgi:hypothetical protein
MEQGICRISLATKVMPTVSSIPWDGNNKKKMGEAKLGLEVGSNEIAMGFKSSDLFLYLAEERKGSCLVRCSFNLLLLYLPLKR